MAAGVGQQVEQRLVRGILDERDQRIVLLGKLLLHFFPGCLRPFHFGQARPRPAVGDGLDLFGVAEEGDVDLGVGGDEPQRGDGLAEVAGGGGRQGQTGERCQAQEQGAPQRVVSCRVRHGRRLVGEKGSAAERGRRSGMGVC